MLLTGTVTAYKPGYRILNYEMIGAPTIDGAWTSPSEWTDAMETQLDGNLNAVVRVKHFGEIVSGPPRPVHLYFLIEFFDDTTNDPGDYLRICLSAADGQNPIGGSSPQTDCYRWDYVGHGTSFSSYRGDGTAWVEETVVIVTIADTLGTSPGSGTPHWIIEVQISGFEWTGPVNWQQWARFAVYDESNSGAGVQAWPAGSVDAPDDWGWLEYTNDFIPEFPAWIIMPLFVTATLSVMIWRKRLKKSETQS